MLDRLLDDVFSRFDNGSRSDAKVVDEFIRFAAMGNGPHRQLMDSDAFRADRVEHGIAQAAVRIVVLNGKNPALGGPGAFEYRRPVDGNDAVEIDHTYSNARCLQLVISLERLVECNSSRDDRKGIGCTLAQDFGAADLEPLFRSIEHRRFWPPCSK